MGLYAGDTDSSRAPGLASGLQGSVNVHHGALLLVPNNSASVLLYFTFMRLSHVVIAYCYGLPVVPQSPDACLS